MGCEDKLWYRTIQTIQLKEIKRRRKKKKKKWIEIKLFKKKVRCSKIHTE